ncbi:MAG TPA: hypothetical protein VJT31_28615 [Rugosimonospora sp.]|nr:hypothetical protein [Rugosimonospora sp.]
MSELTSPGLPANYVAFFLDDALRQVDRADFPLPEPDEWSVIRGTYEYEPTGDDQP